MPPRRFSRYTFSSAVADEDGVLFLTERVPFRFRVLADTKLHTVKEGETLQALAAREYAGLPHPDGLWWVIADFQPDPIFDPTVALSAGTTLYIPSLRTIEELVFASSRRTESDV